MRRKQAITVPGLHPGHASTRRRQGARSIRAVQVGKPQRPGVMEGVMRLGAGSELTECRELLELRGNVHPSIPGCEPFGPAAMIDHELTQQHPVVLRVACDGAVRRQPGRPCADPGRELRRAFRPEWRFEERHDVGEHELRNLRLPAAPIKFPVQEAVFVFSEEADRSCVSPRRPDDGLRRWPGIFRIAVVRVPPASRLLLQVGRRYPETVPYRSTLGGADLMRRPRKRSRAAGAILRDDRPAYRGP